MFVVVDDDINIQNMDEVLWAITARTDPARDTIIIDNVPTDSLDPASPIVNLGSKLGIDATTKWREEGYNREIQQIAQVDDNTRSYVDKRWAEYGLFSSNQTGKK
jgi:4-hydroxy-3-polyprenylbenzoate decarboxylase